MAQDKFWMIADVSELAYKDYGRRVNIPANKAPKRIQPDLETAENELLRLQKRHPDGEFVLLEAVAVARQKQVYVVEPLTDGIPF